MKHTILLPVLFLTFTSTNLIANQYNANIEPATNQSKNITNEQNDAIEIILQDHAQIRKMMSELKKNLNSNMAESRKQFKALQDFLVKHETMEEKAFYPELEKNAALKTIIAELKKEEENAGKAIKEIDGISNDSEWVAKVEQLMKAVETHANNEETKLFPEVKKTLDKAGMNALTSYLKNYRSTHHLNTY